MGRYDNFAYNLPIKLDADNKRRYYDSLIDFDIPKSIDDIYVVTSIGERLDLLAWKYYRDVTSWWIITAANPDLRKDSLYLEPGIQVRIPANASELIMKLYEFNKSR